MYDLSYSIAGCVKQQLAAFNFIAAILHVSIDTVCICHCAKRWYIIDCSYSRKSEKQEFEAKQLSNHHHFASIVYSAVATVHYHCMYQCIYIYTS